MKVSVIIPVYNAEKYIAQAVESALNCSEVYEVLLIEDGSPDNALTICQNLAKKNDKVKLFIHTDNANKGAGKSRNLGIENATGDYIAFLDADDIYLPQRFTKDKEVFAAQPDADGVYNAIGCQFYTEEGKKQYEKLFASELTTVNSKLDPTPSNLLNGLLGNIPGYGYFSLDGLTLTRDFVINNNISFNELRIHQDTVFNLIIAAVGILYPSEIDHAVALRGVHDDNRIIANFKKDSHEVANKRKLMWHAVYVDFRKRKFTKEIIIFIRNQRDYYYLMSRKKQQPYDLLISVMRNIYLLKHKQYPQLHKIFLKKIPFNHKLFSLRNFVIKFI